MPRSAKVARAAQALLLLSSSTAMGSTGRDLSVSLAATPSPAKLGQSITYTLSATNQGSKPVRKVAVKSDLPADAEWVSVPEGCQMAKSADGSLNRISCVAGRLAPGARATWLFVVKPGQTGEWVSAAQAKSSPRDANPANNLLRLAVTVLPGADATIPPAPTPSLAAQASPAKELAAAAPLPPALPVREQTGIPSLPANAARDFNPAVEAGEREAVAAASQQLAFDLYQAQQPPATGNFAASVPDLEQALGMLAAGAQGATLAAILQDGHTGSLEETRAHPALNAAALDLMARNPAAQLEQASAIWGQGASAAHAQGYYLFEPAFLDTLAQDYGPAMAPFDFTAEAAASPFIADTVAPWIAAHTQDGFGSLGYGISERTRLVSASALTLNGAWQIPPAAPAADGRFELLDGTHVLTPLLSFTGNFNYTEGDGYRAFELPLADSDLALTVFMPDTGRFDAFQKSFDASRLAAILATMAPRQATVYLPKLLASSDATLDNGVLDRMASAGAFTEGQADFSRVNGLGYLFLASPQRRALVSLDETGAQASGATVTLLQAAKDEPGNAWSSSTTLTNFCQDVPHYDPRLALARPFVFLIRDRASGTALFIGQWTTPADRRPLPADWTTNPCQVSFTEF